VLPFEVTEGDKISIKSSSDIGFYTIGTFYDDIDKLYSTESTPVYNPIAHKFEWGFVVPVDKIEYWTMKATISASAGATYVVVDNRAPRNGYTHIEVTVQGKSIPVLTNQSFSL
jgi:hypothetical protein